MGEFVRRAVLGGAATLTWWNAALARDDLTSDKLRRGRVTLAVEINGQGPFVFAIDSAASASVIAGDLAARLALPVAGRIGMHTLLAREMVDTVRTDRVRAGALNASDVMFAVGDRLGLDGVDGLIGADLLQDLRLDLRFAGIQRTRLTRSRRDGGGFFDANQPTVEMIEARDRRFGGQLMVEVSVGPTQALAVIDTGALVSIANSALARTAGLSPIVLDDGTDRGRVQSPTGRSASAQVMLMHRLGLGGVSIARLPVLVGDFHTFKLWDVSDRPAMLLGVDVLGLFDGVIIDLKRGQITFEV